MPSSLCTILDLIFPRWQVLQNYQKNAWNWMQIGACSREWQSHIVNYQRCNLREALTHHWWPWNIWHGKYLDLMAIHNPAVWNLFWLKIWLHRRWPTFNERAKYNTTITICSSLIFFFLPICCKSAHRPFVYFLITSCVRLVVKRSLWTRQSCLRFFLL